MSARRSPISTLDLSSPHKRETCTSKEIFRVSGRQVALPLPTRLSSSRRLLHPATTCSRGRVYTLSMPRSRAAATLHRRLARARSPSPASSADFHDPSSTPSSIHALVHILLHSELVVQRPATPVILTTLATNPIGSQCSRGGACRPNAPLTLPVRSAKPTALRPHHSSTPSRLPHLQSR